MTSILKQRLHGSPRDGDHCWLMKVWCFCLFFNRVNQDGPKAAILKFHSALFGIRIVVRDKGMGRVSITSHRLTSLYSCTVLISLLLVQNSNPFIFRFPPLPIFLLFPQFFALLGPVRNPWLLVPVPWLLVPVPSCLIPNHSRHAAGS